MFVAALSTGATPLFAAAAAELKAAYLLNFARLSYWPEESFVSKKAPLVICGLPFDPVVSALREQVGLQVQDRPVHIFTIRSFDERSQCHLLYLYRKPDSVEGRLLPSRGVLLVGDYQGFLEQGGAILFFIERGKLRFEISAESAQAAGVELSARLRNLGRPQNITLPKEPVR
ncbi:Hypothetical protein HDN1F_33430 [gamma proteobacterium HdN1]|nr:Hypothetical protein HDN1F_33430 [gamma proteobacterium HdN1]